MAGLSARAEQMLIAISVYREPADRNALVFQLGAHDWTAARAPDRRGPAPPYQPPPDLSELLAACTASEMVLRLPREQDVRDESWHVDPWVAGQLHQQLASAGRLNELITAHRRAAEYWQWRATAWPQDRRSDLHDLLEARYHMFSASDVEQGSEVTQVVCAQLHAWGDLGREAELIQSTLEMLPTRSASRAAWMHELGAIHQVRGEHGAAYRCYAGAVQMFALLGDYRGVARGQHSLGVLAQAQGDYRRAERHYRRSSAADQRAAGGGQPDRPDRPDRPAESAAAHSGAPVPAGPTTATSPARTTRPATTAERPVTSGDDQPPVYKPARPALKPAPQLPAASPAAASPAAARPAGAVSPGARAAVRGARNVLKRRSVLLPAVAALGLAALTIAGIGAALARPASQRGAAGPGTGAAEQARMTASAWVAAQVSRSAVIACDPAMCAALQRRGLPAGSLLALGPDGPADPLGSDVVIATAAVRNEFGARLASVYAPVVLASFASGAAGIQVRAIAPDGTAAYLRAARADLAARQQFGTELLRNTHLIVSGPARAELAAGRVDTRLLATLATLADIEALRVLEFTDAGPGTSAGVPLRSVEIVPLTGSAAAAWTRAALRFLAAQQAPFRPFSAGPAHRADASAALLVEYPSPSPLGLLGASGAPPGA